MSWNESKNTVFFQRLRVLADQMLDTMEEAERLISIAASEDIVNDEDFVAVGGIDPDDAVALKGVFDDYIVFLDGSASLDAENRRAKIDGFVAEILPD